VYTRADEFVFIQQDETLADLACKTIRMISNSPEQNVEEILQERVNRTK